MAHMHRQYIPVLGQFFLVSKHTIRRKLRKSLTTVKGLPIIDFGTVLEFSQDTGQFHLTFHAFKYLGTEL